MEGGARCDGGDLIAVEGLICGEIEQCVGEGGGGRHPGERLMAAALVVVRD